MNHFELFDLPVAFQIDQQQLAANYRRLQQAFHPDRFASAGDTEKARVMQKAAQINDAYQTLKSPLRRAEYLLELNGVELTGEQATLQDPEFLMQQMAWRERLDEIADGEEDPHGALEQFGDEIRRYQQQLEERFVQLWQASRWTEAADEVRKLKFVFKMQEELRRVEDSLFQL